MEDSARRATANKRLHVNQRFSGALEDHMDGPTKRRHHQRLFGHILSAVGERKSLARFDDGTEKECPSAVLRVEKVVANLPPDIPVPAPSNTVEASEVQEADEEEALPESPELEEAEAAAEESGKEAEEEVVKATTNDNEQPSGMIGQLPTEKEASLSAPGKDYATIKKAAWEKIKSLLGTEVIVKTKKNGSMNWKVIESIEPEEEKAIPEVLDNFQYGLKDFSCSGFKKSEVVQCIFLRLLFKDWRQKVERLNEAVVSAKAKCKLFTEREFLMGLAISIGAAEFAKRGSNLFSVKDQAAEDDDDDLWASLCHEPHFEQLMPFSRWKDIRRFFPKIFSDSGKKDTDPWYEFSSAIVEFNERRQQELCCSLWVSIDETMSAWKPRKTALSGLPNICFIFQKPEPLSKL
jgi:hypothetical protein